MTRPTHLRLVALFALLALNPSGRLAAQGALTPPGAPGPTMKSLAEVEPRTAVQSLPGDSGTQYVIAQPGSYYLAGPIQTTGGKSGVAITVSGVTLDLGGFSIVGTGVGVGVELRGLLSQVTVRDGQIRGFGGAGIISTSTVSNVHFHRLQISAISGGGGISLIPGLNVLVSDCSVSEVSGNAGIAIASNRGTVERCQVSGCNPTAGFTGISAQSILASEVNLVTASGTGQLLGLSGTVVTDSNATNLTQSGSGGATAISGATVRGCSVSNVQSGAGGATGIVGSTVEACAVANVGASSTGGATGISGQTVANCRVQVVNLATTGSGAAVGIAGNTVHGCQVGGVGSPASANGITGISAALISHSTASSVGNPGAASSVTGLKATTVQHSQVTQLTGSTSGVCIGISGSRVSDCAVSGGTTPSGSQSGLWGIQADHISDCRVADLTANGTGVLAGIYGYRQARNIQISGLSGSATVRYGGATGQTGRTESVTVSGDVGIGLSILDNHTVVGCTIEGAVYGISANGKGNVIDGNNLVGPATRGISVSSGLDTATALIVRNQIRGATTAIFAESGAQVGPIVSASGSIAAATSPWANFTN